VISFPVNQGNSCDIYMRLINSCSETTPNSSVSSYGTVLLQKILSASLTRNISSFVLWTTRILVQIIRPRSYKIGFNSVKKICNLSSLNIQLYRAVNTLPLGYKNQTFNAVYGNNRFWFWDTQQINRLCAQNVEFFNVKRGSTYSNHLLIYSLHGAESFLRS
jgi:hypothetical protein